MFLYRVTHTLYAHAYSGMHVRCRHVYIGPLFWHSRVLCKRLKPQFGSEHIEKNCDFRSISSYISRKQCKTRTLLLHVERSRIWSITTTAFTLTLNDVWKSLISTSVRKSITPASCRTRRWNPYRASSARLLRHSVRRAESPDWLQAAVNVDMRRRRRLVTGMAPASRYDVNVLLMLRLMTLLTQLSNQWIHDCAAGCNAHRSLHYKR